MNVLYICRVSSFQAVGNQIDIPKQIAKEFFKVPDSNIEQSKNFEINLCHISNLKSFEQIEIQPATNPRWSKRLNSFLSENGDIIEEGDLLVFERLGRSYCVSCIKHSDEKYAPIVELFEREDKHMLLSASLNNLPNDTSCIAPNYQPYLRAMRTKPFLLLAGISGTGKSRIVKELAFDSCPDIAKLRMDKTRPGNYCLIEVKPNWHDSTELLGYQSAIAKTYVLTPFVKFLAKAMLYPDVPFFVCLDEMNLAPVEQYFAEFLSVLESRKKLESGEIVSEPLINADVFKANDLHKALFSRKEDKKTDYDSMIIDEPQSEYLNANEQAIYETLERDGLRIPQNVIVIGTVNMDETTHQFSRKVIDRAMTIEMNLPDGEPFMDFFKDYRELGYRDAEQPKELYLASEVSADKVVAKLREDNEDKTNDWLLPEVAKTLTALNEALDGTPFKVAYRVQNEMMLYFGELWKENKETEWSEILATTVDQILMMKVLPRIEGDEDLLETPLERLATFCANYPHAAKKVAEMKERLSRSHFASFWP
jgi:hypothetical protein